MLKLIDNFLNGYTQYRLMLYFLIILILVAVILGILNLLPFGPINIFLSALFLVVVCWTANRVLSGIFKASRNLESVYITALILTLILTPVHSYRDLIFFGLIGVLSQAGKYILAINKKHIFNPVALAVFLSALILHHPASWWVGNRWMMPFVALGGLLIVRKLRRFNMVFTFFITYFFLIIFASILKGNDVFLLVQQLFLDSPIFFFAFVMLTEPLTTPPNKKSQILYGGLTGFGFNSIVSETALLLGNIFSYLVSPKEKLFLKLKEKIKLAPDIYDFVFNLDKKLNFLPGQYMEWTLSHKNPDSRGTRRYFTIAASPAEGNLRIGVRFSPNGSSFKKALLKMQKGDQIVASQLAGEFALPEDRNKKLVFIAGGIGVTPYRSITKYLLDTGQKRDIILFYLSKTETDVVYRDVFDRSRQDLGIKVVYVITDRMGYLSDVMIKEEVSDILDRIFYISGPHSMVDAFEKVLKEMRIPKSQIKVDFFPGYA